MEPDSASKKRGRFQLRLSIPEAMIAAAAIFTVFMLTSRLLVGCQNISPRVHTESNYLSECVPHPLLSQEVDPANYEYGCEEIEEMLRGNNTFLGQGHIRDVWLIDYKGRSLVLKPLRVEEEYKRQRHRVRMHRSEAAALNSVRGHPNVVGMLGFCDTTIATEYHDKFLNTLMLSGPDWTTGLSILRIISMALDAARGLQALHEAAGGPIVHFDMKPQQLLLTEDGRVKVNDLNSAHFLSSNASGHPCPFTSGRASQPAAWVAPEKIAQQPLTEKADIYSMGMIFYSLLSGKEPFGHTESEELKMLKGIMPDIDPSWHEGYIELVQDMWRREATERPSAKQVVGRLEAFLGDLSTQETN